MDNTTLTRRDVQRHHTEEPTVHAANETRRTEEENRVKRLALFFSKLDIIVVEMIHSTKRSNTIACSDGPHTEVINQS